MKGRPVTLDACLKFKALLKVEELQRSEERDLIGHWNQNVYVIAMFSCDSPLCITFPQHCTSKLVEPSGRKISLGLYLNINERLQNPEGVVPFRRTALHEKPKKKRKKCLKIKRGKSNDSITST